MQVSFRFTNGLDMCCGVGEIGQFGARPDIHQKNIYWDKVASYDDLHKLIADRVQSDFDGGVVGGKFLLKAFIVDTTPQFWKDYFHNRRNWKRGYTFTNINSGNTITEYSWLMKIKPSGNSDDDDDYWD